MPPLRAMVRRIVGRRGAFLIRKVLTSIAYGVGVIKPPIPTERRRALPP